MCPRLQWNVKGIKTFHLNFVYCELICSLNCFWYVSFLILIFVFFCNLALLRLHCTGGYSSNGGMRDILYLGKGHKVLMLELEFRVRVYGCKLYWSNPS